MADLVSTTQTSNLTGITEHSFQRSLQSDIPNIRKRLIQALEILHYTVINEEPLQAKRSGGFSMNVLDCELRLNIGLSQSRTVSTVATFDYLIPLSMLTKGDLQSIEREADAIIALATMRPEVNSCLACGIKITSDSRFCRGCGAPNPGNLPAELEVMRLTAGARAGHQTVITGLIIILSVAAVAVPLILLGHARKELIGWVLLALGQIVGWSTLVYGIVRLHRTLNPGPAIQSQYQPTISTAERAFADSALPPQSAWSSVTENTTELLDAERVQISSVPLHQKGTDPMS